ncbi:MAG: ribonuclease III [Chitinophagales bacterium]|nr:ribonuclease III [Chitinophagales bacterium]
MIRRLFSGKKAFYAQVKSLTGTSPANLHLYELAFRHSSSAKEDYESNERLEFLGDAVLGAVIADYLFKKFPYKNEGYLTDIRSKMVSRSQLKTVSHKMGIDNFLSYSTHDPMLNKKALTGNALEALVGAVYLDKGYKSAQKFIIKKIVKPFLDIGELEITEFNYKSKLLEWAQKSGKSLTFSVKNHTRHRHRALYKIAAVIDGKEWGEGEDTNKKNAEKQAARMAFESLHISVEEYI